MRRRPVLLQDHPRINDEHQTEKVGEKLRAMMPWISKGKMVDKSRN